MAAGTKIPDAATKTIVDAVVASVKPQIDAMNTTVNELKEKAAQVQTPRHAPYGIVGSLGKDSTPFSYIRAAALSSGRLKPEDAKYEHDTIVRMKNMYGKKGVTFEGGILVPSDTAAVEYYAQGEDADTNRAAHEMRLRVKAFSLSEVNPGLHNQLRMKSIGAFDYTQNTLSDSDGGILRGFPTLGDIIELQRNKEIWSRAGAQEISLPPNGMMVLPKQTGGTVAYWANESGTATKSQSTFGKLELQAKKLFVWTQMTNEMIRFVNPNSEAMFRRDIAIQAGLKADQAFFYGNSNDRPKGILYYPTAAAWAQGVDAVLTYTATTVGANGNRFEYADPDNMTSLLPDAVRDEEGLRWMMNQKIWAKVRTRRGDAVTAGDQKGAPLVDLTRSIADRRSQELNGFPVLQSSQIAMDRTKGSATDLSFVLHGYTPDWIIARFGVMEFLSTNQSDTALSNDMTIIRGIQYVDGGARHAASFVLCDQLLNA